MCGFAGEYCFGQQPADLGIVRKMASRIIHRGPDEPGEFLSSDGRCAIGFRRLSIIDPSGSHQPMTDVESQVSVAFNGEIYNFRELRQELSALGQPFQSEGDTEVLLRAYLQHGRDMTEKLVGMFAFAIYDSRTHTLLLGRDRIGQKPLWYSIMPDRIVFASEAKALLAHPMLHPAVERNAILAYLTMGYVPAPQTIWKGIRKLRPGHLLVHDGEALNTTKYWKCTPYNVPEAEIGDFIADQLRESVRLRMVSDVPLGVLLSGGLDSSIIASLMAEQAGQAGGIRTFTAGFANDEEYDERPLAEQTAQQLGCEHVSLEITPQPKGMLEWVVDHFDEPFADSSAIPLHWICQAAKQHVKVVCTGDGGDEVFGGYDRYRAAHFAESMGNFSYAAIRLAGIIANILPKASERNRLARFARFSQALPFPPAMRYFTWRRLFGPEDLLRLCTPDFLAGEYVDDPAEWFYDLYAAGNANSEILNAQLHDIGTYLPDDLLVKSDIASMAASIELRAPMLDHRLVEAGLGLPIDEKISRRQGKSILRRLFADRLPEAVLSGKKRGFALPLAEWLREPLRDRMVELLLESKLAELEIFEQESLIGLMNDHLTGRDDNQHRLWALMVLAQWLTVSNWGEKISYDP